MVGIMNQKYQMLIVVFHIYDDKRLLMFNGKNIGIEINKNIWIQLPESLKVELNIY